jgi:hypothetical protein
MKFNLLHVGFLLGLIFDIEDRDEFHETARRYVPEGRPLHSYHRGCLGSAYCLVHAGSLLGLPFDPEDGDSICPRNVFGLSSDYMALHGAGIAQSV